MSSQSGGLLNIFMLMNRRIMSLINSYISADYNHIDGKQAAVTSNIFFFPKAHS